MNPVAGWWLTLILMLIAGTASTIGLMTCIISARSWRLAHLYFWILIIAAMLGTVAAQNLRLLSH